MTTLQSSDGSPEVINARRTESLDAPNILKLVEPSTEAVFGRVNVVNIIEKAVLAVTLNNDRDEVLGHGAFFDYPNTADVDPAQWEQWLNDHFGAEKCSALNTLFLHYFVSKAEYSHGAAREIIRTMFNAVPDIHYCLLVVPSGVRADSALANLFEEMHLSEGAKAPHGCTVFACYRHDHIPVLHVRHAKVEDSDDLVPIFNRHSKMLNQTYGDYFLAELIEAQDETMQCVVAEVEGTAVGFMSICTDVNVDLLNECFELGPFHGLRKPHPDDELEAPASAVSTPQATPRLEPERPSSVSSTHSRKSFVKVASELLAEPPPPGSKISSRHSSIQISRSGSRPGSKQGSITQEGEFVEVKTRTKLSETPVAGSPNSLLSDHADEEGIKCAASERSFHQSDTKTNTMSVSGISRPSTPQSRMPKRFVPVYHGESKVICIQLFCIDEQFEMRSIDFLTKVFELFEEYDYVIITVPHLVPEFPLLQSFVRVTPRCPSTLSQELYVFSRAGLIRRFLVREASTKDYADVEKLVKTLDLSENLLRDLKQFNKAKRDDDGRPIQGFVAECCDQIVGVAVLRAEEDIEDIRSHYNIEDFIYYNHHNREDHGHLHHFALNPIFKHFSKHFLKEILRQGHKTCLYYPLYPPYVEKELISDHSLVTALPDMVPVRARRQIVYPVERLGKNAPSERVLQKKQAFALNHINRKLTLEPKVGINARIVVVGASDTGLSFLESFTFCPHLRFNNLTLVSPHGLPGELPPDELRDQMLSSSLCYSQDEYAQVALRTWVNVVYGHMTAIDRKKKHLIVDSTTVVPYDHLVIATGTQYQVVAPTEADISAGATNSEVPNSPDRRFKGVPPKNVFTVNDSYDAAVALHWVENNLLNSSGTAVVYGNTLDAYTCVRTLMDAGLPGDRIVLVEPPLIFETTCFNNPALDESVLAALRRCGVAVHSGFLLAQWNDGEGDVGDFVTSASFTSNAMPLRVECNAFFSFYKKGVNYLAFKAVNDACLVFDGRLVVEARCHTNDPCIRAAGPVTKFQRVYHADQWTHANFSSKEVGIQLASTMLSLFDPTLEPEPEAPHDGLKLIPTYRHPKARGAKLPGGYNYLHVSKPCLNVPLGVLMEQPDYGEELVTGTAQGGDANYFRIHVNKYNTVEAITCFSTQDFPVSNLMCLYGLHERYLNNLLKRHKSGIIKDLYSYFTETWCLAVFHDRFPDFRDEVRELLVTRPSPDAEALEEKVRALIEEDLTLTPTQRQHLAAEFGDSGARRAVETRLLSFLTYNHYHLPMYAKPDMM